MKQIQFNFMKNMDYNIFTTDEPSRMKTSFLTSLCTIDGS